MKTLHLNVSPQTPTDYELRLIDDKDKLIHTRTISAEALVEFVRESKRCYQKGLNLQALGTQLFDWLNGKESVLNGYDKDTLLHIHSNYDLENLAWELLYNANFLCANRYQPFTPLRLITSDNQAVSPANRPLRLLFMACAPEGVKSLNFETEESLILAAIDPANVDLVVEESGTLAGLKQWLVNTPEDNFFDVVHLTGHAGKNTAGNPMFMMEDDTGQQSATTAEQIAEIFNEKGIFPRLVFLSGCETAHSNDSLCAELVKAGIPAVLGWAKPIADDTASETAKVLYSLLAEGVDLGRAVAKTRLALIDYEQTNRDKSWHTLRFYSDHTPAIALVTALDTSDRKAITPPVIEDEFFKTTERVCPASRFVGRRRLLQQAIRCLRAPKQDKMNYAQGVLLLGMGGLGKSSLAARLCDRLKTHFPERLILIGKLDETALKKVFGELLHSDIATINTLLNKDLPLNTRLGLVFKQFPQLSFLIVLDDFEQNIDIETQRVDPTAYAVLTALLTAIHQSNSKSRVIITSRYAFAVDKPLHLLALAVIDLRKADLQKKIRHLISDHQLEDRANDHAVLFQQATDLGAGNPRLLERLYKLLAVDSIDAASVFQQLADKQVEFREELLLETLLSYQTPSTRQLCATAALFEIFMPKAVLAAIFEPALLEPCLAAALAVGLIETYQERYFVSRLLLPLVADELDAEQRLTIYAKAAVCLSALWWDSDYKIKEEEIRELIRIARAGERKDIFLKPAQAFAQRLYAVSSYNEAHALYEELLPIQRELKDKKSEGVTLNNISQIYAAKGDYDTALRYLSDSLKIDHELGDKQGEGATLNNISQIYAAKGDYDTALRYLTDSLKIDHELGDKAGEGATLNNLATIAHAKGDYDTALRYLTDSLKIRQDIGDKAGEGATLNNISQIYKVRGDYDTSQIYDAKGDYDTALRYLTDSLKIRQYIGDKAGEGATLNNISSIYNAKGDYDTALRYLTDSLKIQQDIGDKSGECATLFNIGHIHWQANEQQQAKEKWLQVYQIAKQINLAKSLAALESLAKQLDGEGLDYWEQLSAKDSDAKPTLPSGKAKNYD
ncbi:MAG: tetratricopeptide repeat protein [Methylococcales bacterium]|nr:tetratricopeptide repeat protein [Methylococcales bacterium]